MMHRYFEFGYFRGTQKHSTDSKLHGYYWEELWNSYKCDNVFAQFWLWNEPGVLWC